MVKALTFDEYAQIVDETCVVDPSVLRAYSALGLVGEVGECAAYAASEADSACMVAGDVLILATLLGEIAEMIKKSRLRGDDLDPEVVQATVLENCLDIAELVGRILDEYSSNAIEFDEVSKEAGNRLRFGENKNVFVPLQDEEGAVKEAGDVLWYLAAFAKARGFTLAEAAEKNMAKLRRRKSEGKIRGSGSER